MADIRTRHVVSLRAVSLVLALLAATTMAHAQTIRRTTATAAPEHASRVFAVATPGQASAAIPGTLTRAGETPRQGTLFMTERWMIFRDHQGEDLHVPVVRLFDDGRPPAWALERVADGSGRYEIPAWGTFETAAEPAVERLLRSRPSAAALFRRTALAADSASAMVHIASLASSGFADTLYRIAGRPRAAVGLLANAQRATGDAAVYVTDADSIALDPLSARSLDDLRGMLAHELGHRLQRHRPGFFAAYWHQVPPIEDPHVYGFASEGEHQVEAFRFAVVYLQTTSGDDREADADLDLLELYEALMPGARLTVLALLAEPVYARHRLQPALGAASPRPLPSAAFP